MINKQIEELNSAGLLAEVVGYETDEVALTALGAEVSTYGGGEFLDFTSGIAVHACGHNHPEVVTAIQRQAASVIHTSDVMRHAPQLELAQWLRDLIASRVGGEAWSVQFMNSGSESVDAAAKLALKATGRTKFIAFVGGFHGRTLFATALSCSNSTHRGAYEPFLAGLTASILHAPAPRCATIRTGKEVPCCADALEALIESHPGDVAAVFFEAQQGEGGYFPMDAEAARKIREMTHRHNILLIADEIQSGFGRTGRWFGFEHLGIVPDIIVFGKAVGGGLPLAGIAAPRSLLAKWSVGEHGTTFGGNPIACAAGLAALRRLEESGLVAHAAELGEEIKTRLGSLVGKYGVFDVRGNGLMIGLEIRDAACRPDYARVALVKQACREQGLLLLSCGARIGKPEADNSTIRLLPPLTVTHEEIDRGLTILTDVLISTHIAAK